MFSVTSAQNIASCSFDVLVQGFDEAQVCLYVAVKELYVSILAEGSWVISILYLYIDVCIASGKCNGLVLWKGVDASHCICQCDKWQWCAVHVRCAFCLRPSQLVWYTTHVCAINSCLQTMSSVHTSFSNKQMVWDSTTHTDYGLVRLEHLNTEVVNAENASNRMNCLCFTLMCRHLPST